MLIFETTKQNWKRRFNFSFWVVEVARSGYSGCWLLYFQCWWWAVPPAWPGQVLMRGTGVELTWLQPPASLLSSLHWRHQPETSTTSPDTQCSADWSGRVVRQISTLGIPEEKKSTINTPTLQKVRAGGELGGNGFLIQSKPHKTTARLCWSKVNNRAAFPWL